MTNVTSLDLFRAARSWQVPDSIETLFLEVHEGPDYADALARALRRDPVSFMVDVSDFVDLKQNEPRLSGTALGFRSFKMDPDDAFYDGLVVWLDHPVAYIHGYRVGKPHRRVVLLYDAERLPYRWAIYPE